MTTDMDQGSTRAAAVADGTVSGEFEAWCEDPACGPWGRTQTAELQAWPTGNLVGGINATITAGALEIRIMAGTGGGVDIVVERSGEQLLGWATEDGTQ